MAAFLSSFFGIFYGLGVLRLFRWGVDLSNKSLFPIVIGYLLLTMPWSIYRSMGVQDEYSFENYNPIDTSLSYQWKQIPQVSVFADVFTHNQLKNQRSPSKTQISLTNPPKYPFLPYLES